MDRKDAEILQAIAELGTGTSEKIEAETGIPKSTVHYRINRLQEEGILENDLYDVNLENLGLDVTIITEITAEFDGGDHEPVGDALASIEGVNQVYFTMGEADFHVISHLPDRETVAEHIHQFENITAVQETSSRFVISTVKNEPRPLNDFSTDRLEEDVFSQSE